MTALRTLSERLLSGEVSTAEHHPFTPLAALEEVAPRTAFVSSFANATAIDTDEGLVLVDTGSFFLASQVHELVRGHTRAPLHAAVFTHGHVDHCFGVELYEAEAATSETSGHGAKKPRVIAHERVPRRFARYRETQGYNACINARQFSVAPIFPVHFREPDELYRDELVLDVGGERIELHHARGETDDHTWVWLPSRRVLATGDLFIWACPNAGNPQKVQRYPREWAAALRTMRALDPAPEVLLPGHGPPIWGREPIARALEETAELLESLVSQTLAAMNTGASLDAILATVRAPAHLLERPYLRPIYDEPAFIVRNIYRLYGGWWDGDPASLKPARSSALASELAALAGGVTKLVDRAIALSDAGEHALACHLVELAAGAAPDEAVFRARSRIYARRADVETSLMAKGIFGAASRREVAGG